MQLPYQAVAISNEEMVEIDGGTTTKIVYYTDCPSVDLSEVNGLVTKLKIKYKPALGVYKVKIKIVS
ncbi:MAG: hypothetical protein LBR25_06515 [Erysipelotrichaceae bacterium]|jgi:hypothetical protein|nr:hypothetical protein [Erysipelotrichaceae bacterium]